MVANVLIQSVWFGISSIVAVLARKRFNAGDWQTLMITAAPPTLLTLSIFWNALFHRVSIRRYLVINWACTMLPLAAAVFAQSFWHLLVCFVCAAIGAAGWSPVAGDLLKRFYGDRVRGRAFALVNSAMYIGMMLASYTFGHVLDRNENAFRWYFPIATGAYAVGVIILQRLLRATGAEEERSSSIAAGPLSLRRAVQPLIRLREILRSDRTFYRYEAAFMTYGVGWMICNALLPVLATDRLRLSYTAFAGATQVIYPLCMLVMTYPMGWVMDRIGPACLSGLSFAWLSLYPLGLMFSHDVTTVGVATAFYGTAMAGVHIGWMLGPVTLAPSPDRVAQYVAIHTSLVGLRGILAQGVGMLIYRMTDSFTWPFAVAMLAFLWASLQMWRLRAAIPFASQLHKVVRPPTDSIPDVPASP
jgi:MFS family permease